MTPDSRVAAELHLINVRRTQKLPLSEASTLRMPTEGHLGGFDIRRFIKKNMRIGLAISIVLHALAIAGYYLVISLVHSEVPPPTHVIYLDPSNLGPPPYLTKEEVAPLLRVAQPGSVPVRSARSAGIQRTSGSGGFNSGPGRIGIEHGSGTQLSPVAGDVESPSREISSGYAPTGSSRYGLGEPAYQTLETANVPPGEPIRQGRGIGKIGGDSGGEGSDGRPSRQFGTGSPGPTLAAIGGTPHPADIESRDPRIVIPSSPPRVETVVVSLNPIIDWIEKHQKSVPVTLQRPENLNQMPGDVTTWVTFNDTKNQEYTMYLLGRKGELPQLNIFLTTQHEGTLLQDLGAKGVNEVFKHGVAVGDADNLTVQLSLLPPGSPKAREMMAVFQAWWEHVRNAAG